MAETKHGLVERRLKMRPVEDAVLRAVLNIQVATAHLVEDLEDAIAPAELSLPAYNVLGILRGHPHGHSRRAINARLVYRKADVTRIIDRLERRGLVQRIRDKRDRRLSVTRITPKGLEVMARLDPPMNGIVNEYRGRLSRREYAELNRLLDHLYAHKVES